MWRKNDSTRWSQLFDDLDAQSVALTAAEDRGEVAERTRIETSQLRLTDRLRPALGHEVGVRCLGAGQLRGRLDGVGVDWLQLTELSSDRALVPLGAVVAVSGLSRWSAGDDGELGRRLGFRSVLRRLGRDRAPVRLVLADGSSLAGTVDRVGADFLELAEHPLDEPRRAGAVLRVWTLPLTGIAVVRRPTR